MQVAQASQSKQVQTMEWMEWPARRMDGASMWAIVPTHIEKDQRWTRITEAFGDAM